MKSVTRIEFMREHLETLAVALVFSSLTLLPVASAVFALYLFLFSNYWYIIIAYFIWLYFDRNTPQIGGRSLSWIRSSTLLRYATDYFRVQIVSAKGVKLNPNKNYLLCAFPHGVITLGLGLGSSTGRFSNVYPEHYIHSTTLNLNFYIPFYREYLLALGGVSASAQSINWILNHPGGGKIATLVVGGAEESLYNTQRHYFLVLKNRKGFIKLALKSGASIIPVFSFGEREMFKHVSFEKGSFGRKLQEGFKKITGVAPVLFYGRGLFQNVFGLIPLRKPISIVCGEPIDIKKVDNPSQEDIDELHATFVQKITKLFNEHKDQYVADPENCNLSIV